MGKHTYDTYDIRIFDELKIIHQRFTIVQFSREFLTLTKEPTRSEMQVIVSSP